MSTFQEKLDEFYLNYDTVCLLKEDSKTEEIVNMFKTELDYPETLTTALMKFNKTFLKSVVMRIKVRQQKVGSDELKSDLLKYNTDLEPILDKLLTDKFKKQYEEVISVKKESKQNKVEDVTSVKKESKQNKVEEVTSVKKESKKNKVEEIISVKKESKQEEVEEVEEVEEEVDEEVGEEEVDEEEVDEEEVDEEVDEEEVNELTEEEIVNKFLDGFVEKSDKGVLSLVDMYERYAKFCKTSDYDAMQPSPYKKYVRTKMGKPEGKGDKSIYKGYKLVNV